MLAIIAFKPDDHMAPTHFQAGGLAALLNLKRRLWSFNPNDMAPDLGILMTVAFFLTSYLHSYPCLLCLVHVCRSPTGTLLALTMDCFCDAIFRVQKRSRHNTSPAGDAGDVVMARWRPYAGDVVHGSVMKGRLLVESLQREAEIGKDDEVFIGPLPLVVLNVVAFANDVGCSEEI
ncbi:hypothetical protein R6Q59_009425 [Mikania micrantha]